MIVLRSLLSVLLFASLLAPSAARAGEEEDQAALFVTLFEMMCPALMAEGLSGESGLLTSEGPLATAISGDACGCIDTSLKAMSPRQVNALMEEGKDEKGVETMVTRCMAVALKPRIGEICTAAAAKEGMAKDDAAIASSCGCAQARADALSEDEMTAMFSSDDENSADALFEGCEPEA